MPCDSSYMEASGAEKQRRLTNKLLCYVYKSLGEPIPKEAQKAANDYYGQGNGDPVPQLCAVLRRLNKKQFEIIVYNAHNPLSRKLADWVEEHNAADKAAGRGALIPK